MDVLVIESNRRLRQRLARALHAQGFRSALAADGITGLALARGGPRPGLIYVSEDLAGLCGGDVLSALGRDPALSTVPTLLRANRRDSLLSVALMRAGSPVVTDTSVDAIVRRIDDLTCRRRPTDGSDRSRP